MDTSRLPMIPPDLLAWLTAVYPDRAPDLADTDREVWYHAGQAAVVARLRQAHDDQTRSALEDT